MEDKVRAEYEDILATIVVKQGTLVGTGNTYYGWIADDYYHLTSYGDSCRIVSYGTPVESEWTEFGGTFTEHDPTRHGIDLPGVSCACGKIQGRTMRLQSTVQEVAQEVFLELHARLTGRISELKSEIDQIRSEVVEWKI